jgi:hypothetical protein
MREVDWFMLQRRRDIGEVDGADLNLSDVGAG